MRTAERIRPYHTPDRDPVRTQLLDERSIQIAHRRLEATDFMLPEESVKGTVVSEDSK